MNELGLRTEISDYEQLFKAFEGLLKVHPKFHMTDDYLATALCELYATMAAHQILEHTASIKEFDLAPGLSKSEAHFEGCQPLPKHETVQKAARELLAALASGDKTGATGALREMGVLALCPSSEGIFARVDLVTQRVTGRAQQLFLVEVSRFAAKVGDYERARRYVQHARTFDPSAWELYNIYVVEGLIALSNGGVDEAVQCLTRSISACLAYERARAQCCVRAPSLELAGKLLDHGERAAVLEHLLDCQNVWEFLQPQIDNWIHIIKSGGKPDFQGTGNQRIPENSSQRLRMQWMNACSLAKGPVSAETKATAPKAPEERRAQRERWIAENERFVDSLIAREIAYLDKGLVIPPDPSSTKSSEPIEPE